jgi:uncharacterized membrane protein YtjA (UPF0391 family)
MVKIYRHFQEVETATGIFWNYALVFLLIAIVAAIFGFGGIAITSAYIAKILFFIFLVLFLVSLVTHLGRRRI